MRHKFENASKSWMFKIADSLLYRIEIVLAIISSILLLYVMFSTTLDVAFRQINNSGIRGVVDLNSVLIVPIIFLSLAYAQRVGRHVSMSVLVDRVSDSIAGLLKFTGLVIGFVTIAWMGYESLQSFQSSFESNESSFSAVRLILWPYRLAVVAGLFAWAIELLLQMVRGRPQKIHADT